MPYHLKHNAPYMFRIPYNLFSNSDIFETFTSYFRSLNFHWLLWKLVFIMNLELQLCLEYFCWALMSYVGEAMRRQDEHRRWEYGEKTGKLVYLTTRRNLHILLVPRHPDILTSCGHPSLARHKQDLWQCLLLGPNIT